MVMLNNCDIDFQRALPNNSKISCSYTNEKKQHRSNVGTNIYYFVQYYKWLPFFIRVLQTVAFGKLFFTIWIDFACINIENIDNCKKWPQCKGYGPCTILSLGQKVKIPKNMQKTSL